MKLQAKKMMRSPKKKKSPAGLVHPGPVTRLLTYGFIIDGYTESTEYREQNKNGNH